MWPAWQLLVRRRSLEVILGPGSLVDCERRHCSEHWDGWSPARDFSCSCKEVGVQRANAKCSRHRRLLPKFKRLKMKRTNGLTSRNGLIETDPLERMRVHSSNDAS